MALVAMVNEEEVSEVPFQTQHVSIVLEDQVVMSHRSWTDALVFFLFGLVYALNLKYPEKLSGSLNSSRSSSWIWMMKESSSNLSYRH